MSYTLDLARTGLTGQSTILNAIECGRINGTNNLFGTWKVEYGVPHGIYLQPAESLDKAESLDIAESSDKAESPDKEAAQAATAPDAPLLEAEIAALLRETEGSLHRPDAGRRDAAGVFHQPAADPTDPGKCSGSQSKNIESKVNEIRLERLAWDRDIRISDPERAAKAVSSSNAQSTQVVLAVLLAACATGWIIGVPPSLIDRVLSVPVERNVDASGQAPGSKQQTTFAGPATGRETTPSVWNTAKIAAPAPSVHHHRPGYTKSAAQQLGAIRTSNVAQQSPAPSEAAAWDPGRRPRIVPSLMPFPETRPETIEGWIVRDVAGATAVLEGPNGVWRAARGDTLPRVGRVESIVRWGSRWIVVTSSGLISTP
jgi:hypothetical protein